MTDELLETMNRLSCERMAVDLPLTVAALQDLYRTAFMAGFQAAVGALETGSAVRRVGNAVVLPNGLRRIDYIRARKAQNIYTSQIVRELKALGDENSNYNTVWGTR